MEVEIFKFRNILTRQNRQLRMPGSCHAGKFHPSLRAPKKLFRATLKRAIKVSSGVGMKVIPNKHRMRSLESQQKDAKSQSKLAAIGNGLWPNYNLKKSLEIKVKHETELKSQNAFPA